MQPNCGDITCQVNFHYNFCPMHKQLCLVHSFSCTDACVLPMYSLFVLMQAGVWSRDQYNMYRHACLSACMFECMLHACICALSACACVGACFYSRACCVQL